MATFLGGFGAIAGLSAVPARHAPLIIWTIAFSGLAVGSGIIALLPRFRKVDPNNDRAVNRYFRRLLLRRGIFTIAAFVCLLLAILFAIITSFSIENDPVIPTATLTVGWDGSGTTPDVSADLSVSKADPGTVIDLVITGPSSSNGTGSDPVGAVMLASASSTVGQNGTTEVDLKFVPSVEKGSFKGVATDATQGRKKTLATVSIPMPPAFVSPTTTTSTAASTPVTTTIDPPRHQRFPLRAKEASLRISILTSDLCTSEALRRLAESSPDRQRTRDIRLLAVPAATLRRP